MTIDTESIIERAANGERLSDADARLLAGHRRLDALVAAARRLRDLGHGAVVTYSPKVFIPLTRLCRDVCRYCTFARTPRGVASPYLSVEEAVAIARAGAEAGCHEALFTLGDRPEARYRVAREALAALGHDSTIDYLVAVAQRVREATGLLPHVNPGVMRGDELARLREVSVSAGLMLESLSARLARRGGPHHGCPDKVPQVRLATLRAAGEQAVAFTTGVLVGIGDTRRERIEAYLALRALHERYGHLQEIIVQNFWPKPATPMAPAPAATLHEHLWSIAVARLVFGAEMSIQAPPNLAAGPLQRLLDAGINDWGGVSPVTPDHVNPEAPWPGRDALRQATAAAGKTLVPRLAVYPRYVQALERWVAAPLRGAVLSRADADGLAREDRWSAGIPSALPELTLRPDRRREPAVERGLQRILAQARDGREPTAADIVRLFAARGEELAAVCTAADRLRAEVSGDTVSYVVNRNINYTNICYFRCRFCAFSKGRLSEKLRGRAYDLDLDEIARRTREAWDRGATEVCLQGGIHPHYNGQTYLDICAAVKRAAPAVHVHAFSALEVWHGARTLELALDAYLAELKRAGLGTLPGTAAEILDDDVRAVICPDKISTAQWLEVMQRAHELGLRTTATIMFGHVDAPGHWASHLLRVRRLQARTGGFTEFVPLPFVHMEAPLFLEGRARAGATLREAVLMHAVARLVLHPHLTNIQTSWVKMGPQGAAACLRAGANDLGGTLMNESITRAAGAAFGEELDPRGMQALIAGIGRTPRQRSTLYADVPEERTRAGLAARPLEPAVATRPRPAAAREHAAPLRFGLGQCAPR